MPEDHNLNLSVKILQGFVVGFILSVIIAYLVINHLDTKIFYLFGLKFLPIHLYYFVVYSGWFIIPIIILEPFIIRKKKKKNKEQSTKTKNKRGKNKSNARKQR